MTAASPRPDAPADPLVEQVVSRYLTLPKLVDRDADLVRRGRFLTCDIEIGIGPVPLMVSIDRGRVVGVTRGPFLLRPWTFAIRAEATTWARLLAPVPEPGWHDLMALSKVGRARIEGNLQPFMANLQYVKDLLTAPRAPAAEGARP